MSGWDYELAKEFKRLSGTGLARPIFLEGTVVKTAPLTVSLCGGEVMAPPMALDCVVGAQGLYRDKGSGHLYLEAWNTGDRVACCLMGQTVAVLGRLGGTAWQIPTR